MKKYLYSQLSPISGGVLSTSLQSLKRESILINLEDVEANNVYNMPFYLDNTKYLAKITKNADNTFSANVTCQSWFVSQHENFDFDLTQQKDSLLLSCIY